jgi:hypothetical protein
MLNHVHTKEDGMTGKCSPWLSLALLWIGPGSAWGYATGIQILHQEHHVWGSAGNAPAGGRETSYDQTSADLLHVAAPGTYWDETRGQEIPLLAWSQAGDFRAQAQGEYWFSEAYAHSTYLFTPQADGPAWALTVHGAGEGVGLFAESHIRLTLDDLTMHTSLVSIAAPSESHWQAWSSWHLDWTDTYWLDPTHTYALTLFAHAGRGDGPRGAFLEVDLLPIVPAPGALLLALLGAMLVGRMRSLTGPT